MRGTASEEYTGIMMFVLGLIMVDCTVVEPILLDRAKSRVRMLEKDKKVMSGYLETLYW